MSSGTAGNRRDGWLDLHTLAFAGFLSAGHFKADPRFAWIPVDLTLLTAAVTIGSMLWCCYRQRFVLPVGAVRMLLLFLLFTLPLIWTDWHAYAGEKSSRLLTLTALAALAPFVLCPDRAAVRRFVHALVLIGGVIALDAGASLLLSGRDLPRLTAFGASTIALGRDLGVPLIWLSMLAIERKIGAVPAVLALAGMGVLMVSSGSRGPLVAALGSLLIVGLLVYLRRPGLMIRFALAVATILGIFLYGMSAAPGPSEYRVRTFLQGDLGRSELSRLTAYEASWRLIQERPLGIGWGGFASHIDPARQGGEVRQYPHNLFIETLLEAGWLAGLYLAGLLGGALYALFRYHYVAEVRVTLALLCFALINALVSGDLNDNRLVFALTALGLHVGRWGKA